MLDAVSTRHVVENSLTDEVRSHLAGSSDVFVPVYDTPQPGSFFWSRIYLCLEALARYRWGKGLPIHNTTSPPYLSKTQVSLGKIRKEHIYPPTICPSEAGLLKCEPCISTSNYSFGAEVRGPKGFRLMGDKPSGPLKAQSLSGLSDRNLTLENFQGSLG